MHWLVRDLGADCPRRAVAVFDLDSGARLRAVGIDNRLIQGMRIWRGRPWPAITSRC
jgi:hypothetical protein